MNTTNNNCPNCILKSNAVSILSSNELRILDQGCSKTAFKKGELIFKEGAPSQYITFIRDGFVKLCKKGIGGKDFILSISKKGAYLGIQNLSRENKENYFSATAITDSNVCFIDIESFSELLRQNGEFAIEVISFISNDELNYFDRLVNNVQHFNLFQNPGL